MTNQNMFLKRMLGLKSPGSLEVGIRRVEDRFVPAAVLGYGVPPLRGWMGVEVPPKTGTTRLK
jgi:hypothetical protein